jgi:hypothetical protein
MRREALPERHEAPLKRWYSGAFSLSSRFHHLMVAPLLFAVPAAVLLVYTNSVLASRVRLQSRAYGRLLEWIEG